MSAEIRIYIADLAAYNNGKLHGVWINALDDLDDIQEQINTMLAQSIWLSQISLLLQINLTHLLPVGILSFWLRFIIFSFYFCAGYSDKR